MAQTTAPTEADGCAGSSGRRRSLRIENSGASTRLLNVRRDEGEIQGGFALVARASPALKHRLLPPSSPLLPRTSA